MKRIALYIRVSTIEQAKEGYSLAAQERTLREYARAHGYDTIAMYSDEGISAKDINHRAGICDMLRDIKDHSIDAVAVIALSRITRSVADLYNILSLFSKYDVSFISLTESFDTSSAYGRAMIGMMGVFAQMEREITGERVALAMQERAIKGLPLCGQVLGYDYNPEKGYHVPNAPEAETINGMMRMYLEARNISAVAARCREMGIHGKLGRVITAPSLYRILVSPFHCGYVTWRGELHKGVHEPIVDVRLHNDVQTVLDEVAAHIGRPRIHKLFYIQSINDPIA